MPDVIRALGQRGRVNALFLVIMVIIFVGIAVLTGGFAYFMMNAMEP